MAPTVAVSTSSNPGLIIGVTIGGVILVVAILACVFPFLRNWLIGRQSAKKHYHIRKLSLPDKIGVPLLVKSHSRDNSYTSVTPSYNADERAWDDVGTDVLDINANYKRPPARPRVPWPPETNYGVNSRKSSDSVYSPSSGSFHHIPLAKPPPSQPIPPVPVEAPSSPVKRKGSPQEASTAPAEVERGDTYYISRMLKARVERGGVAIPLRQPTGASILERPGSIKAPSVPTTEPPPLPPLPLIPWSVSSASANSSRQIRPLPNPRNKSLKLPKAPMEPVLEAAASSDIFPEHHVKTLETQEPPIPAGQYAFALTEDSPKEEESINKRLTDAFRYSTLSASTNDVSSRYPSIGAYPMIPPNSAPLESSGFPSTARYSMFPMSAALRDSTDPEFDAVPVSMNHISPAFPSSSGLPSALSPKDWTDSIINEYGFLTSQSSAEEQPEYATTAPLRVQPAKGKEAMRENILAPTQSRNGTSASGETRKKPKLEIAMDFDVESMYGTDSGGTSTGRGGGLTESAYTTNDSPAAGYMSTSPPESLETSLKARLREVGVKSAKQSFQLRPEGVEQAYQARTFI